MTHIGRPAADPRQRLAAFAFAAAELLLETDAAGMIRTALGAARGHFGVAAERLAGKPVADLLMPSERRLVPSLLALLGRTGRLSPQLVHLNDGRPMVLGGLVMPNEAGAFCLTLSALPAGVAPAARPVLADGREVLAAAAERMSLPDGGGTARVTLISADPGPDLTAGERAALNAEIAAGIARVAPGALPGRLGEDRFAVLHDDSIAPEAMTKAMAETVAKALGRREVTPLAVTGNYELADGELDRGQVLRALGVALGRFEQGGAAALEAAGLRQGLMGYIARVQEEETALRAALRDGAFSIQFQPIVELASRKAHHHEALLRPLRRRGALGSSPAEMVAVAEEAGISDLLDLAVIERVLAVLDRAPKNRSAAANVSPLSLEKPAFGAALLKRLDAARGMAPRFLVEITETAELRVGAAAVQTLEGLRERGVRLCLDDFGAGSAGFRALAQAKFDFVKLDGSYVQRMAESESDRALVGAAVNYCEQTGAIAVAEHVETEAQCEALRVLGVPLGQGFLFGRPGAQLR